jgi:hypothetical protein
MIAWKFLREGAIGPFSDVAWPPPGSWLEASADDVAICRTAVHACTVEDLPLWLDDELWRVELYEPVQAADGKLAAPAGRLLERIARWDGAAAIAYAEACAARAHALAACAVVAPGATAAAAAALAADAARCARHATRADRRPPTMAATTALCAARIAGLLEPDGIAAERAWQARWLADRLALPT